MVVLTTSVTATTGVLAVLADATLSHRLVSLWNISRVYNQRDSELTRCLRVFEKRVGI